MQTIYSYRYCVAKSVPGLFPKIIVEIFVNDRTTIDSSNYRSIIKSLIYYNRWSDFIIIKHQIAEDLGILKIRFTYQKQTIEYKYDDI